MSAALATATLLIFRNPLLQISPLAALSSATAAAERDVLDPWGDLRLRYDMQQLLQRRTLPVVSVRGR